MKKFLKILTGIVVGTGMALLACVAVSNYRDEKEWGNLF